jgi:hypothetical protein
MEILAEIPFGLDAVSLMKQAHVEPDSEYGEEFRALIELARRVGKPKAAYTVAFVDRRSGDTIEVGGIAFKSRMLARNLESTERLFPQVATCGHEMDEHRPAEGDLLNKFWWDSIKSELLGAANQHLNEHLHRRHRLGKTAIMRPGSGDASVWPIEQQRQLFDLLGDVHQAIGVKLTDSFLMIPNKTTSGILFPTEVDFRSCEVCHRENCPSRSAAFNEPLWEQTQTG